MCATRPQGCSPDAEVRRQGAMLSSVHPHPLRQKTGTDGVDTRGPPVSSTVSSPGIHFLHGLQGRSPRSSWSLSSGIPSHPPSGGGVLSEPPGVGASPSFIFWDPMPSLARALDPPGLSSKPCRTGAVLISIFRADSACSKQFPRDTEQLHKHWMSQEMSPWTQTCYRGRRCPRTPPPPLGWVSLPNQEEAPVNSFSGTNPSFTEDYKYVSKRKKERGGK